MVKTRRHECERPVLKLRIGQRVYSKWKDCKTYPGKVKAVNHADDTLMIEFDDGIIYKVNAALEIQHDDISAESDDESDDENPVMDQAVCRKYGKCRSKCIKYASKYQPLGREVDNTKVAVPIGSFIAKRTVKRRPWTEEEKAAVMKHLGKLIIRKTLPGKNEINNCLRTEPASRLRNCRNVKDFCRNKIQSLH